MRKSIWYLFGGVWLLLAACSLPMAPGESATLENEATPGATAASPARLPTKAVAAAPLPVASPTLAATATPAPTATPTPLPSPTAAADLAIQPGDVVLYPVPDIYSGDRVTVQVMPQVPAGLVPEEVTVHVLVNGAVTVEGALSNRNLAGQAVGIFPWIWDTTGVTGNQQVTVVLDREDRLQAGDENPDNNQATLSVTVLDRGILPPVAANPTWVTAETSCCVVHAVSGTAAYRDLPALLQAVETAVAQASTTLHAVPERQLDVYFVDKVIGQGGYAASSMVVSYLDRPYSGQGLHEVLVHEAVHLLDRQFAPQRISFLAEGLAVWATGGHYKPEDLAQRTAALVALDAYVPLPRLIDDFYPVQHEIGYLQAAGFVQYLVERAGWEAFRAFYTDVTADDAPTLSQAVDMNLQIHYSQTLAQIEAAWLASLAERPPDPQAVADLQTTLRYYDVMRRYQQAYDPAAHFLTAWLPYPQEVQERGNPADLNRHPEAEINVVLETMLTSADAALRAADYTQANGLLDSIERVLGHSGDFLDPLAVSYRDIVRKAMGLGYQVQAITLAGSDAVAVVNLPYSTSLTRLHMVLRDQGWIIVSN